MLPQNRLPSDTDMLTREFVQSRFYNEVFKPQLDAEIDFADDMADMAEDHVKCFRWNKYGVALRKIRDGWIPTWIEYKFDNTELDEEESMI